jgi:ribosomal protein L3
VEAVTIVETLPMVVIGIVGYIETRLYLLSISVVSVKDVSIRTGTHLRRRPSPNTVRNGSLTQASDSWRRNSTA